MDVNHDIVVIGSSAGGLPALLQLTESLPKNFPAAIFVISHVGANVSLLPDLLTSNGRNRAIHPRNGQRIEPGVIYVAPPDRHLLIGRNSILLSTGPKEHHTRPAIDPTFRSAALSHGVRVIGVLLSGR